MKAKYKTKYQKHEIHKVDCNHRIVLEDLNVEEFAVALTMRVPAFSMPTMETFRGEADRYIEQLDGRRGFDINISDSLDDRDRVVFRSKSELYFEEPKGRKGCDIEMSDLIDKRKRITFVTAIAGSGKSVLVKRLTCNWADGKLFNDFKVCITFECRELNYFVIHKGKRFEKDELISEFLKEKFGFDVKDSKNVLFIVDGLDELYDINEDYSIIGQLLDLEKSEFIESKIIITGRPHIEEMLFKHGENIGGLRRVEIIGLSDEQVDECIRKFASSNKEVAKIMKVKDSSKSNLKLYHVPQYLSTICCVALISEETGIKNAAELYCWAFYLLLKKHAEKDESHDKQIPDIFNQYSKDLLVLSEICHKLLDKNSIIFDGNIQLQFGNKGKREEFLRSLFVDVPDDFNNRKQFMHLTLMDFLSAIYVCTTKNRMKIIVDILQNRSYQTVVFYCQLMSGLMYDGIIKHLFTNSSKLKESDAKCFFHNVLKSVRKCVTDFGDDSFNLSIDVIMCLMNKDISSKQFILSIVNQLSYKNVGNNIISSSSSSVRKLIEMMKALIDDFKCLEVELKKAFENVHFGRFNIIELNELKCAKFLASVDWIRLSGDMATMTMTVRDICKEIDGDNEYGKFRRLNIVSCKLEDEVVEDEITKSSKLEWLEIRDCTLTEQAFFNLCKWMITVEQCILYNIKDMKVQWWNVLVVTIMNAMEKDDGGLALRELEIWKCPLMNDEIKKKVI